jgi:hypothetical protein
MWRIETNYFQNIFCESLAKEVSEFYVESKVKG